MSALPSQSLLLIADTCLVWGHRLSEWCGHGPQLEEDIALTNTALDVIGQARSLYQLYALRAGNGLTEDKLAYFRGADAFQNVAIAAVENGDYAQTVLRSLILSAWFVPLWRELAIGRDPELAAIAVEAEKAARVQRRHASDWTIRFGDGTAESRRRIEHAISTLAPWVPALLAAEIDGTDRARRENEWRSFIAEVMAEATLDAFPVGSSSDHAFEANAKQALSALLHEMQSLAREHPEAVW